MPLRSPRSATGRPQRNGAAQREFVKAELAAAALLDKKQPAAKPLKKAPSTLKLTAQKYPKSTAVGPRAYNPIPTRGGPKRPRSSAKNELPSGGPSPKAVPCH